MNKNKKLEKFRLQDDFELLDLMVQDAKKLEGIYQP